MKKSKLFMGIGTAVLAVSALFATKANKKFSGFSTWTAKFGSSSYFVNVENTSKYYFTVTGATTSNYAYLQMFTSGGTKSLGSGALVTVGGNGVNLTIAQN
jgi:hypothetical protein